MKVIFVLLARLLITLAEIMRPGGLRGAVAAESIALRHQLLVMSRFRERAPDLKPWDRLLGISLLWEV